MASASTTCLKTYRQCVCANLLANTHKQRICSVKVLHPESVCVMALRRRLQMYASQISQQNVCCLLAARVAKRLDSCVATKDTAARSKRRLPKPTLALLPAAGSAMSDECQQHGNVCERAAMAFFLERVLCRNCMLSDAEAPTCGRAQTEGVVG